MSRLRNNSSILFNKILSVVHKSMLKILWCCVFCGHIIEKLLELMESRTMPPPSLQIYLRSRVTLTFDQLTPKLIIWCHFHVDHLCHWHQDRFIRFGNRRMNGRTDGHVENIRPPPARQGWQRNKKQRAVPAAIYERFLCANKLAWKLTRPAQFVETWRLAKGDCSIGAFHWFYPCRCIFMT